MGATRRGRERLARDWKSSAASAAETDGSMRKLDGRMQGRERLASWNRNECQLVVGGGEISLRPLKPKDSICHLPW